MKFLKLFHFKILSPAQTIMDREAYFIEANLLIETAVLSFIYTMSHKHMAVVLKC